MVVLKGTIRDGQIKLSAPADLPDGTEVTVLANGQSQTLGIPDDQWPSNPEDVDRLLARMDRVEPFEMTAAEEADIDAWREKTKQFTALKQVTAVSELFE